RGLRRRPPGGQPGHERRARGRRLPRHGVVPPLLIIFLEVPLNLRMAAWPHGRALALGAFLIGAGFGSMAFATGFRSVALTVVIWTFGEMILLPASSAYAAEIAPVAQRGSYIGLYTM